MYQTNDPANNKKCKSDLNSEFPSKKQKVSHNIFNKSNKHKFIEIDSNSSKKLKLLAGIQQNDRYLDEPQGLIWDSENYSCAYNSVFSTL